MARIRIALRALVAAALALVTAAAATGERHVTGAALAYVTPWNGAGYTMAKQFAGKFTHVAPVWYNVDPAPDDTDPARPLRLVLSGAHDVDAGWIAAVRASATPAPKIVPRFILQNLSGEQYQRLARGSKARDRLVAQLVDECARQGFDGLVLEATYVLKHFGTLVRQLAARLHADGRELIVTISPHPSVFGAADFVAIAADVDYVSLMTYDYSSKGPGPNSPLGWMKSTVEKLVPDARSRHKVLLGLNFYGYDFAVHGGATAILGEAAMEHLAHSDRLQWHADVAEHSFRYRDSHGQSHIVYYPSVESIDARVALAQELGVGVSVWEIGQGLAPFFGRL